MLKYTLGEKLGIQPAKPENKEICGCGRGYLEYVSHNGEKVSLYCISSGGKTLDGKDERLACCKTCEKEEYEENLEAEFYFSLR